tara:strand:+ start:6613 stop:6906 length:294 start_codon:yes stop_codon:yes gene_type:complete
MADKATTTPTGEKDYTGFTFSKITFNIKKGISGIITLNGFDYNIKNNEIVGDGVVSQQSSQQSAQNIIPVNDTKATDIKHALFNQLQGTGITMKIVP